MDWLRDSADDAYLFGGKAGIIPDLCRGKGRIIPGVNMAGGSAGGGIEWRGASLSPNGDVNMTGAAAWASREARPAAEPD
jgi:hypothetical protein